MTHAWETWPAPAPEYVLLVGDATYDPRGNLGPSPRQVIPTRLLETDVFETASDLWFVDVEGDDGVPEMAIGRLPVATPDECRQVVERILRHETSSLQAPGIRRVLLVADEAEEFSVMNAGIAGSIPPSVATTFLDAGAPLPPGTDLQTLLIENWLRTDVVQYSGHGARTTWSAQEILHIDDVPLLESSRLPVVVAMNCLNGFFHHVATPALGEALLLEPEGGPSPTGAPQASPATSVKKSLPGSYIWLSSRPVQRPWDRPFAAPRPSSRKTLRVVLMQRPGYSWEILR